MERLFPLYDYVAARSAFTHAGAHFAASILPRRWNFEYHRSRTPSGELFRKHRGPKDFAACILGILLQDEGIVLFLSDSFLDVPECIVSALRGNLFHLPPSFDVQYENVSASPQESFNGIIYEFTEDDSLVFPRVPTPQISAELYEKPILSHEPMYELIAERALVGDTTD